MLMQLLSRIDPNYSKHYVRPQVQATSLTSSAADRLGTLTRRPLISILMTTYDSDIRYLERAVRSIERQSYPDWELCICDDASPKAAVAEWLQQKAAEKPNVHLVLRKTNGHMSAASNDALALVSGDFVALMDHDDELAVDALLHVAEALNTHPEALMIYTDEDKVDGFGYRFMPSLKPRWSPELAHSQNYVCHLGVYQTQRMRKCGGFRVGYEGSQDHDLLLRFVHGLDEHQILHVPHVLYHWRTLPTSTAGQGVENKPYALINGRKAVADDVARETPETAIVSITAIGMYRTVRWPRPRPHKEVQAQLIIHGVRADAVAKTARKWREASSGVQAGLHLYVDADCIPFNSMAPAQLPLTACSLANDSVASSLESYVNGVAVRHPDQVIILVRADLVPSVPSWLAQLCGQCERAVVGLATTKVCDANHMILHSGWCVDASGCARSIGQGNPSNTLREFGRFSISYNCDAVSRHVMAVQASDLLAAGGMICAKSPLLSDLTLSFKLRALGRRHCVDAWIDMIVDEETSSPETLKISLLESPNAFQAWKSVADDQSYRLNNYIKRAPYVAPAGSENR